MSDSNEWQEEAKSFARYAFSSLLDAVFLVVWVLLQYGTGKVIELFPLDGIDSVILEFFKYLFGLTTLAPILYDIVKNVVIIHYRTVRTIQNERFADGSLD